MKPAISLLILGMTVLGLPTPADQIEVHPVPCRVRDGANPDLFVMTLGAIQTPLAQGRFYPDKDQVRLTDGKVMDHYYRDDLGVKYYKPIDNSVFPVPPSGWCSWYYYYYYINEDEIRQNARWLADNLKDYGLNYIQIDDGWEGVGRGYGENRDWTTINNRFTGGMAKLATEIEQFGFKAGLWIAPHGQSSKQVVHEHPGAFLLKPDGTTLSDTWEGNYLVDPSTDEGKTYLHDLFGTLTRWGYDYFKIDGQPCVVDEYRRCAAQMQKPSTNPVALYRQTLETIQKTIGPKRYLLGCWEGPMEGAGLTQGWRTGGDVMPGWDGFMISLDATMRGYYLHNTLWYSDPDVVMVRQPLTLEQARVWATLQGLTGQPLMASDRMMDLPEERVELYRRIFPAVDIRPLDLFPSPRHKSVWDLKVNHLGRNYDVVGLFNFVGTAKSQICLNWAELGLDGGQPLHVYDFWHHEYLGVYRKGFSAELEPTSCRVLTLVPATSDIQLLSTSRHLTQGWFDLVQLSYDAQKTAFHGRSRVIKNDPYMLTFAFPPEKNYTINLAKADGLAVKVANHQGWATVEFTSESTRDINWSVRFQPAPWYHYPIANPGGARVELNGLDQVSVKWNQPGFGGVGSYWVSLNGELLGGTKDLIFPIRNLVSSITNAVSVASVWEDGLPGTNPIKTLTFKLDSLMHREYSLTELVPSSPAPDQTDSNLSVNQSALGLPLSVGGQEYEQGFGIKTGSSIEYNLHGLFQEFTAAVGIDATGKDCATTFTIVGDGRELWKSGAIKQADGAKPVSISIAGIQKLELQAEAPGAGKKGNQVDWLKPVIRRK